MKKVLIINIFGIGDVLFTTPIISNLKAHSPDISISYLCNKRSFQALENNSKIDRIFVYERDDFVATYKKSKLAYFKRILELANNIKEERYDAVIDVSMNGFMSFLCFFAGIKQRIGFNYKNRSRFLTTKIPLKGYEDKHVVEYYLDLLKEINIPLVSNNLELFVTEEESTWAQKFLDENGLDAQRLCIGIVPGGGDSWGKDARFKRWPAQNYAKIADKIVEKFNARIILFGGEKEIGLCNEVAGLMQSKPIMACGKTTVGQFAALSAKCQLVITNDGGPLHIAVAAGAKTFSIFGPVDENVYGPYPSKGHSVFTQVIACRPCYRRFRKASCDHVSCLALISADEVYKTIENILGADCKADHIRGK